MFSIYKILTGESLPLEYYQSLKEEQLKLGQAVRLENNELTTAKLNQKPEFICAGARQSDRRYPVLRIRDDIQFCVDASINPSCIGDKMQLSQDGLSLVNLKGGYFKATCVTNNQVFGFFEVNE